MDKPTAKFCRKAFSGTLPDRLIEGLKKEIMKKAIFAPESSREFQKRLNDLINTAENLNKIEMKTPLERIELAEKELKAAKEALQTEIPEYIKYKSIIYRTFGYYKDACYSVHNPQYPKESYMNLIIQQSDCKPSTKEAFDKQNEIIRVPDCIEIFVFNDKTMAILFNDNKQMLHYDYDVYSVSPTGDYKISSKHNFKLTKCERSDLKAGDVAFKNLSCHGVVGISELDSYCIILNDTDVAMIEDKTDVLVLGHNTQYTWYKVEKI